MRVPVPPFLVPKKGFDGNKKVKGVKRNIITDKDGDILEASTTPANIHDSKSAYALAAMLVVAFPWIRRIYADRGYRGNFIEEAKMIFMAKILELTSRLRIQIIPVSLSRQRKKMGRGEDFRMA